MKHAGKEVPSLSSSEERVWIKISSTTLVSFIIFSVLFVVPSFLLLYDSTATCRDY